MREQTLGAGMVWLEVGIHRVQLSGRQLPPTPLCQAAPPLPSTHHHTPLSDLVFIQNGMLQPWLEGQGLASATQLLVYFAVAKAGDTPVDGKTDVNPEGLTSVWGPHSEAVAQRLAAGGLACKVRARLEQGLGGSVRGACGLDRGWGEGEASRFSPCMRGIRAPGPRHAASQVLDRPAFLQAMLEKLVWISAFMLVGVTHGGCSVGEVEKVHSQQVGVGRRVLLPPAAGVSWSGGEGRGAM